MAYNKYYSLPFKDVAGRSCEVEIYKDDTAPSSVVELTGSFRPAVSSITDNEQSLYTPVRGQSLQVEFVVGDITIDTFIDNSDIKWRATLLIGGNTAFIGYLVTDDCQELFIDHNHVIRLNFTDGLGLLKDVPIKDGSGNDPYGLYTQYQVIRMALDMTKLILPVNVFNDISQTSTPGSVPNMDSNVQNVNAKSLMKDSSSFLDCYTILSDILSSNNSTVFQQNGEWQVVRWSTLIKNGGSYKWHYTSDDATKTRTDGYEPTASIGSTKLIREVSTPMLISVQRPTQYVQVEYDYIPVPEIIRNFDLQEGTVTSSTSTDVYMTPAYLTQTSRTAKIHKKLNGYGYEYERRLEIDGASDFSNHTKYIKTEEIDVEKGDTITFQLSYKQEFTTAVSGTTLIFQVYLDGLFGTDYTLDDNTTWQASTTSIISGVTRSRIDDDNFYMFDLTSQPMPDSGRLHFKLFIGDAGSGGKAVYRNMNISYNGVITNRLKNTKGEYIKISTSNVVKNKTEIIQFYNTSYSQLYKGSLVNSTGAFNRPSSQEFQRFGVTEEKSFLELNAIGYYFANYRSKYKIEGSFYGTHTDDSGSQLPIGFFFKYKFQELPNKYFAMIDCPEIDWRANMWNGSFIELYDTTIDTDLTTYPTAEYQYISK
jgi:hypothetical protein